MSYYYYTVNKSEINKSEISFREQGTQTEVEMVETDKVVEEEREKEEIPLPPANPLTSSTNPSRPPILLGHILLLILHVFSL